MRQLCRFAHHAAWSMPPLSFHRVLASPFTKRGHLSQQCRRWLTSATASEIGRARTSDPDAVAVVVGASRGIGLAATQALFRRFRGRIVALCRDPDSAGALCALTQFDPHRLSVTQCDITDEASVASAASAVRDAGDGRLDLVLNCVGLLHDGPRMPETSLARVDPSFLRANLEVWRSNLACSLRKFSHRSLTLLYLTLAFPH